MGFETEFLRPVGWNGRSHTLHQRVILDMDRSESRSAAGHASFNQFGDKERSYGRHSADDWLRWWSVILPAVRLPDAAFAKPEIYEYLETPHSASSSM